MRNSNSTPSACGMICTIVASGATTPPTVDTCISWMMPSAGAMISMRSSCFSTVMISRINSSRVAVASRNSVTTSSLKVRSDCKISSSVSRIEFLMRASSDCSCDSCPKRPDCVRCSSRTWLSRASPSLLRACRLFNSCSTYCTCSRTEVICPSTPSVWLPNCKIRSSSCSFRPSSTSRRA